jgi:hypothetical protein
MKAHGLNAINLLRGLNMLHPYSAPAHRPETPVGRKANFRSAGSPAPCLGKASGDATVGRASDHGLRDLDALDWLRFWLPESDWHVRHTTAARRT